MNKECPERRGEGEGRRVRVRRAEVQGGRESRRV